MFYPKLHKEDHEWLAHQYSQELHSIIFHFDFHNTWIPNQKIKENMVIQISSLLQLQPFRALNMCIIPLIFGFLLQCGVLADGVDVLFFWAMIRSALDQGQSRDCQQLQLYVCREAIWGISEIYKVLDMLNIWWNRQHEWIYLLMVDSQYLF